VDNIIRAVPLLVEEIKKLRKVDRKKLEEIAAKYDNQKILKNALQTIKANLSK